MTTTPTKPSTKDDVIERFVTVTHSSPDEAFFYLRFARGNLSQAIQNFFADDSSDGETSRVLPPPPPRFPSPQLSGFPPPRFPSPQLSGFLSPPLPHRKHSGDSDHEHDREGTSAKRVHTPTKPLPAVYTTSGAGAGAGADAEPTVEGPDCDAEPSVESPSCDAEPTVKGPSCDAKLIGKGPSYDTDLALAKNLQREYDTKAADYRLGWGSDHPSVTKPKGAFPDHWIHNPNWAGLGAHFNTSLGGVNASLGAIPSEPFPQQSTRCQAPEDILSPLTWEHAMEVGVKEERWMLINIQDPAIPKCQVLNRDIWNDVKIIDLIKEKFIFLQCRREEYRAREYISFHFSVSLLKQGSVYPHIAILDPRNGEQLKLWTGYVPKAKDFIADIRDFLDKFSLNPRAKKPIGTVKGIEIKPRTKGEAEAEAEEPWYIQSVEQPESFFDDLYGISDAEARSRQKSNSSASQSPEINVSHFDELPYTIPTTETLCLSHSSSYTRPARTITINFSRPSGRSTTHQFSLLDQVRAMYEWLESQEVGMGKRSEGRRLRLSFDGSDLSAVLNERIADIPGLIDSNGGEGVNILVSIDEEGF